MKKKIKITFPDGSKKAYDSGITASKIAFSIGERLGKAAIAAKINDALVDLDTPVKKDSSLKIITFDQKEGKEIFWHSSAHILAMAVKELFPKVKLTIGPPIENGFYYDFARTEAFTPKDIEKIEEKMKDIIKQDLPFERINMSVEDAKKEYKKRKNKYKLEILDNVKNKTAGFYKTGRFSDLCRGPHVPSTGKIGAIKLTKFSGVYWRADEKNDSLQRVYGIAFPEKKEMNKYLKMLEEAEKRDHRKIGKQMDLFSLHEESPGVPFFHPNGMKIINSILGFWRNEHEKRGYVEIQTPLILNKSLWKQSGHWEHYKENMYFTEIDGRDYAIKPMNCPGAILVYKTKTRSYRELPLKFAELGLVHRHELSGVIHGLMRVRAFTQDDAHIFMTEDQIKDEIEKVIELVDYFYKVFGFEYHIELSTRPEKAMGSKKLWDNAEEALKKAMESRGVKYTLNEGDGAFYGPKIDFHIKDAIGRTWQCATIQLDFQMPEKFDLTYIGKDNKKHRPVMIHRVVLGSIERFLGILIEHYAGKFPTWLAPVQVKIIPVADRFLKYADKVRKILETEGIKVETDCREASVEYKVRDAQLEKVPYTLIAGQKEVDAGTIAVRNREGKVQYGVKPDVFVKTIKTDIVNC